MDGRKTLLGPGRWLGNRFFKDMTQKHNQQNTCLWRGSTAEEPELLPIKTGILRPVLSESILTGNHPHGGQNSMMSHGVVLLLGNNDSQEILHLRERLA
jgi:hypothetical protein